MVRLRALDIIYGNPQGVYRAGDLVQGHVILDFSEQLKLRSEFKIDSIEFIINPYIATQAYIPKRRTLIQVLPLCKFFCYLPMHICILPENCN